MENRIGRESALTFRGIPAGSRRPRAIRIRRERDLFQNSLLKIPQFLTGQTQGTKCVELAAFEERLDGFRNLDSLPDLIIENGNGI